MQAPIKRLRKESQLYVISKLLTPYLPELLPLVERAPPEFLITCRDFFEAIDVINEGHDEAAEERQRVRTAQRWEAAKTCGGRCFGGSAKGDGDGDDGDGGEANGQQRHHHSRRHNRHRHHRSTSAPLPNTSEAVEVGGSGSGGGGEREGGGATIITIVNNSGGGEAGGGHNDDDGAGGSPLDPASSASCEANDARVRSHVDDHIMATAGVSIDAAVATVVGGGNTNTGTDASHRHPNKSSSHKRHSHHHHHHHQHSRDGAHYHHNPHLVHLRDLLVRHSHHAATSAPHAASSPHHQHHHRRSDDHSDGPHGVGGPSIQHTNTNTRADGTGRRHRSSSAPPPKQQQPSSAAALDSPPPQTLSEEEQLVLWRSILFLIKEEAPLLRQGHVDEALLWLERRGAANDGLFSNNGGLAATVMSANAAASMSIGGGSRGGGSSRASAASLYSAGGRSVRRRREKGQRAQQQQQDSPLLDPMWVSTNGASGSGGGGGTLSQQGVSVAGMRSIRRYRRALMSDDEDEEDDDEGEKDGNAEFVAPPAAPQRVLTSPVPIIVVPSNANTNTSGGELGLDVIRERPAAFDPALLSLSTAADPMTRIGGGDLTSASSAPPRDTNAGDSHPLAITVSGEGEGGAGGSEDTTSLHLPVWVPTGLSDPMVDSNGSRGAAAGSSNRDDQHQHQQQGSTNAGDPADDPNSPLNLLPPIRARVLVTFLELCREHDTYFRSRGEALVTSQAQRDLLVSLLEETAAAVVMGVTLTSQHHHHNHKEQQRNAHHHHHHHHGDHAEGDSNTIKAPAKAAAGDDEADADDLNTTTTAAGGKKKANRKPDEAQQQHQHHHHHHHHRTQHNPRPHLHHNDHTRQHHGAENIAAVVINRTDFIIRYMHSVNSTRVHALMMLATKRYDLAAWLFNGRQRSSLSAVVMRLFGINANGFVRRMRRIYGVGWGRRGGGVNGGNAADSSPSSKRPPRRTLTAAELAAKTSDAFPLSAAVRELATTTQHQQEAEKEASAVAAERNRTALRTQSSPLFKGSSGNNTTSSTTRPQQINIAQPAADGIEEDGDDGGGDGAALPPTPRLRPSPNDAPLQQRAHSTEAEGDGGNILLARSQSHRGELRPLSIQHDGSTNNNANPSSAKSAIVRRSRSGTLIKLKEQRQRQQQQQQQQGERQGEEDRRNDGGAATNDPFHVRFASLTDNNVFSPPPSHYSLSSTSDDEEEDGALSVVKEGNRRGGPALGPGFLSPTAKPVASPSLPKKRSGGAGNVNRNASPTSVASSSASPTRENKKKKASSSSSRSAALQPPPLMAFLTPPEVDAVVGVLIAATREGCCSGEGCGAASCIIGGRGGSSSAAPSASSYTNTTCSNCNGGSPSCKQEEGEEEGGLPQHSYQYSPFYCITRREFEMVYEDEALRFVSGLHYATVIQQEQQRAAEPLLTRAYGPSPSTSAHHHHHHHGPSGGGGGGGGARGPLPPSARLLMASKAQVMDFIFGGGGGGVATVPAADAQPAEVADDQTATTTSADAAVNLIHRRNMPIPLPDIANRMALLIALHRAPPPPPPAAPPTVVNSSSLNLNAADAGNTATPPSTTASPFFLSTDAKLDEECLSLLKRLLLVAVTSRSERRRGAITAVDGVPIDPLAMAAAAAGGGVAMAGGLGGIAGYSVMYEGGAGASSIAGSSTAAGGFSASGRDGSPTSASSNTLNSSANSHHRRGSHRSGGASFTFGASSSAGTTARSAAGILDANHRYSADQFLFALDAEVKATKSVLDPLEVALFLFPQEDMSIGVVKTLVAMTSAYPEASHFTLDYCHQQSKRETDIHSLVLFIPMLIFFMVFLMSGRGLTADSYTAFSVGFGYEQAALAIPYPVCSLEALDVVNGPAPPVGSTAVRELVCSDSETTVLADVAIPSDLVSVLAGFVPSVLWPSADPTADASGTKVSETLSPVGALRIRQHRVKSVFDEAASNVDLNRPNNVEGLPEYIRIASQTRFPPYQRSNEDRSDHIVAADNPIIQAVTGSLFDGSRFMSCRDLNASVNYLGRNVWYRCDGYAAQIPFDSTRAEYNSVIKELLGSDWIDRQTRALIVEYLLFHETSGMMLLVKHLFELPAGGQLTHSSLGRPFFLHVRDMAPSPGILACYFIFLVILTYYTVQFVLELIAEGVRVRRREPSLRKYLLHNVHNFTLARGLEIFTFLLAVTNIVLFIYLAIMYRGVSWHRETQESVWQLAYYPETMEAGYLQFENTRIIAVANIIISIVLLVRLTKYLPGFTAVVGGIQTAIYPLLQMFFYIVFLLFAFGFMGSMVWGHYILPHRSIIESTYSFTKALWLAVDLAPIQNSDQIAFAHIFVIFFDWVILVFFFSSVSATMAAAFGVFVGAQYDTTTLRAVVATDPHRTLQKGTPLSAMYRYAGFFLLPVIPSRWRGVWNWWAKFDDYSCHNYFQCLERDLSLLEREDIAGDVVVRKKDGRWSAGVRLIQLVLEIHVPKVYDPGFKFSYDYEYDQYDEGEEDGLEGNGAADGRGRAAPNAPDNDGDAEEDDDEEEVITSFVDFATSRRANRDGSPDRGRNGGGGGPSPKGGVGVGAATAAAASSVNLSGDNRRRNNYMGASSSNGGARTSRSLLERRSNNTSNLNNTLNNTAAGNLSFMANNTNNSRDNSRAFYNDSMFMNNTTSSPNNVTANSNANGRAPQQQQRMPRRAASTLIRRGGPYDSVVSPQPYLLPPIYGTPGGASPVMMGPFSGGGGVQRSKSVLLVRGRGGLFGGNATDIGDGAASAVGGMLVSEAAGGVSNGSAAAVAWDGGYPGNTNANDRVVKGRDTGRGKRARNTNTTASAAATAEVQLPSVYDYIERDIFRSHLDYLIAMTLFVHVPQARFHVAGLRMLEDAATSYHTWMRRVGARTVAPEEDDMRGLEALVMAVIEEGTIPPIKVIALATTTTTVPVVAANPNPPSSGGGGSGGDLNGGLLGLGSASCSGSAPTAGPPLATVPPPSSSGIDPLAATPTTTTTMTTTTAVVLNTNHPLLSSFTYGAAAAAALLGGVSGAAAAAAPPTAPAAIAAAPPAAAVTTTVPGAGGGPAMIATSVPTACPPCPPPSLIAPAEDSTQIERQQRTATVPVASAIPPMVAGGDDAHGEADGDHLDDDDDGGGDDEDAEEEEEEEEVDPFAFDRIFEQNRYAVEAITPSGYLYRRLFLGVLGCADHARHFYSAQPQCPPSPSPLNGAAAAAVGLASPMSPTTTARSNSAGSGGGGGRRRHRRAYAYLSVELFQQIAEDQGLFPPEFNFRMFCVYSGLGNALLLFPYTPLIAFLPAVQEEFRVQCLGHGFYNAEMLAFDKEAYRAARRLAMEDAMGEEAVTTRRGRGSGKEADHSPAASSPNSDGSGGGGKNEANASVGGGNNSISGFLRDGLRLFSSGSRKKKRMSPTDDHNAAAAMGDVELGTPLPAEEEAEEELSPLLRTDVDGQTNSFISKRRELSANSNRRATTPTNTHHHRNASITSAGSTSAMAFPTASPPASRNNSVTTSPAAGGGDGSVRNTSVTSSITSRMRRAVAGTPTAGGGAGSGRKKKRNSPMITLRSPSSSSSGEDEDYAQLGIVMPLPPMRGESFYRSTNSHSNSGGGSRGGAAGEVTQRVLPRKRTSKQQQQQTAQHMPDAAPLPIAAPSSPMVRPLDVNPSSGGLMSPLSLDAAAASGGDGNNSSTNANTIGGGSGMSPRRRRHLQRRYMHRDVKPRQFLTEDEFLDVYATAIGGDRTRRKKEPTEKELTRIRSLFPNGLFDWQLFVLSCQLNPFSDVYRSFETHFAKSMVKHDEFFFWLLVHVPLMVCVFVLAFLGYEGEYVSSTLALRSSFVPDSFAYATRQVEDWVRHATLVVWNTSTIENITALDRTTMFAATDARDRQQLDRSPAGRAATSLFEQLKSIREAAVDPSTNADLDTGHARLHQGVNYYVRSLRIMQVRVKPIDESHCQAHWNTYFGSGGVGHRQLRFRKNASPELRAWYEARVAKDFPNTFSGECLSGWDNGAHESKEDFAPTAPIPTTIADAFTYRRESADTGRPDLMDYTYAFQADYPPRGFFTDIPFTVDSEEAFARVNALLEAGWIDDRTRLVVVKMVNYNANLQLYISTRAGYEVTAGGIIAPFSRVFTSANLLLTNAQLVGISCVLWLFIFGFFMLKLRAVLHARDVWYAHTRFPTLKGIVVSMFSFSVLYDIVVIGFTITVWVWTVFARYHRVEDELGSDGVGAYPHHFEWICAVGDTIRILEGINLFMYTARFVFVVTSVLKMNIVQRAFVSVIWSLLSVLIIFLVALVLFSFTMMLFFAYATPANHTFQAAFLQMLVGASLGGAVVGGLEVYRETAAPILQVFFWLICVVFLYNMWMSVMLGGLGNVAADQYDPSLATAAAATYGHFEREGTQEAALYRWSMGEWLTASDFLLETFHWLRVARRKLKRTGRRIRACFARICCCLCRWRRDERQRQLRSSSASPSLSSPRRKGSAIGSSDRSSTSSTRRRLRNRGGHPNEPFGLFPDENVMMGRIGSSPLTASAHRRTTAMRGGGGGGVDNGSLLSSPDMNDSMTQRGGRAGPSALPMASPPFDAPPSISSIVSSVSSSEGDDADSYDVYYTSDEDFNTIESYCYSQRAFWKSMHVWWFAVDVGAPRTVAEAAGKIFTVQALTFADIMMPPPPTASSVPALLTAAAAPQEEAPATLSTPQHQQRGDVAPPQQQHVAFEGRPLPIVVGSTDPTEQIYSAEFFAGFPQVRPPLTAPSSEGSPPMEGIHPVSSVPPSPQGFGMGGVNTPVTNESFLRSSDLMPIMGGLEGLLASPNEGAVSPATGAGAANSVGTPSAVRSIFTGDIPAFAMLTNCDGDSSSTGAAVVLPTPPQQQLQQQRRAAVPPALCALPLPPPPTQSAATTPVSSGAAQFQLSSLLTSPLAGNNNSFNFVTSASALPAAALLSNNSFNVTLAGANNTAAAAATAALLGGTLVQQAQTLQAQGAPPAASLLMSGMGVKGLGATVAATCAAANGANAAGGGNAAAAGSGGTPAATAAGGAGAGSGQQTVVTVHQHPLYRHGKRAKIPKERRLKEKQERKEAKAQQKQAAKAAKKEARERDRAQQQQQNEHTALQSVGNQSTSTVSAGAFDTATTTGNDDDDDGDDCYDFGADDARVEASQSSADVADVLAAFNSNLLSAATAAGGGGGGPPPTTPLMVDTTPFGGPAAAVMTPALLISNNSFGRGGGGSGNNSNNSSIASSAAAVAAAAAALAGGGRGGELLAATARPSIPPPDTCVIAVGSSTSSQPIVAAVAAVADMGATTGAAATSGNNAAGGIVNGSFTMQTATISVAAATGGSLGAGATIGAVPPHGTTTTTTTIVAAPQVASAAAALPNHGGALPSSADAAGPSAGGGATATGTGTTNTLKSKSVVNNGTRLHTYGRFRRLPIWNEYLFAQFRGTYVNIRDNLIDIPAALFGADGEKLWLRALEEKHYFELDRQVYTHAGDWGLHADDDAEGAHSDSDANGTDDDDDDGSGSSSGLEGSEDCSSDGVGSEASSSVRAANTPAARRRGGAGEAEGDYNAYMFGLKERPVRRKSSSSLKRRSAN